ncbi:hypothetical protein EDD15DRAFT_2248296 [Pisolithus albus]|nr:hypothetical protein EDD15DRAFT_2248296 [Pisolithus albus]
MSKSLSMKLQCLLCATKLSVEANGTTRYLLSCSASYMSLQRMYLRLHSTPVTTYMSHSNGFSQWSWDWINMSYSGGRRRA